LESGLARVERESGILHIDNNENGSRLDRVLIRHLGSSRRSLILRLIRKGNVRVNKKRCKPEFRLQSGDEVFLPLSLRQAREKEDDSLPASLLRVAELLPVLFEDDWLLAVNKPAGMVVHGGSGHSAGLIEALKEIRGLPDLRLAHRLDRDTSGVLLMAKNLEALRRLTESFRERDMQKTYFALVAGHPFAQAGRMTSKLAKGVVRGGERMVIDSEEGKEAITDYQVMIEYRKNEFDYAMMALKPHSGRTHQLRVQLQNESHPILGDNKYAGKDELSAYKSLGGRGLMLHAWRLRFKHPVKGNSLELKALWPENWQQFLLFFK
jgi:23S rRNA pseudouridine955/2504/2580 synthase